MKKTIIILVSSFVAFLGIFTVGGYFYARKQLPQMPALLKTALSQADITLDYKSVEIPSSGLSLTLKEIQVEGKSLQYPVKAASATLSISVLLSTKPILISFKLNSPIVEKTKNTAPPTKKDESPMAVPKALSFGLAFVQLELGVTDAYVNEFGVEGLNASVRTSRLSLGSAGLRELSLRHDVSLKRLKSHPWLGSLAIKGSLDIQGSLFRFRKTFAEIGPFRIATDGELDLGTQNWNIKLDLPETELSSASSAISSQTADWLKKISGKLGLKAAVSGSGLIKDKGIQITDSDVDLVANQLVLTIDQPTAKGNIEVNGKAKWAKKLDEQYHFDVQASLSDASISAGKSFFKPKGIPLNISATGDGKNRNFNIKKLDFVFHKLVANATGTVSALADDPTASFQLKIPETSLLGWEQFFPEFPNSKTTGSIVCDVTYDGSIKNWKLATLNAFILANQVSIPVPSNNHSKEGFHVSGPLLLNGQTNLAMKAGTISKLDTQSKLDLSQVSIKFSDQFDKPAGQVFKIALNTKTEKDRVEIKDSSISLMGITAALSGTINSLKSPTANVNFSTNGFPFQQVRSLSPFLQKSIPGQAAGQLTVKGKVSGPILSTAKAIDFPTQIQMQNLSFQWKKPESTKLVDIKKISGLAKVNRNSFELANVLIQSPGTSASVSMTMHNFLSPKVRFSAKADPFALKDFVDEVPKNTPVGLAVVPVAPSNSSASSNKDFRSNPMLRNLQASGKLSMLRADLGSMKAESITAELSFENMRLSVSPAIVRAFGGTITSKTEWNGQPKTPITQVRIKTEGVDANQFMSNWSDKSSDLVVGKLNSEMDLQMVGMTAEEIKKTVSGKGTMQLKDGQLTTLKFTKKPVEALRGIPGLGNLSKNSHEERLNDLNGSFTIEGGTISFSDIVVKSNAFDANTKNLKIDSSMNLMGEVIWQPKESLVGRDIMDLLKDGSGNVAIPLTLNGPVSSPSVGIDSAFVSSRLKENAARKIGNELKQQLEGDLGKKLGEGLKGLFK